MKSKNLGDGQGDGQGVTRTSNRHPAKEKTLFELYEEAMKEPPKDIEELGIGGTTRKVPGEGSEATGAEVRPKARKATERINGGMMAFQLAKAKAFREAITARSKEGAKVQQTYAQVVHRYAASHQVDKAPPTRPKP